MTVRGKMKCCKQRSNTSFSIKNTPESRYPKTKTATRSHHCQTVTGVTDDVTMSPIDEIPENAIKVIQKYDLSSMNP